MDTPAVAPADLPQPEQERLPVIIPLENGFPAIPACHHMINRPAILVAQRSRHVVISLLRPLPDKNNVAMKHLTPKDSKRLFQCHWLSFGLKFTAEAFRISLHIPLQAP